ncbi:MULTISPECIES: recombinase family protein [unclassified Streptomyces]|uniref:recombinase family protein n=1 Tax=unclassified Streptomyces TaxID=2593676 RepID=UPI003D8ACFFD
MTTNPSAEAPLAFVYDRCATTNLAMLELRLAALAEYVEERHWRLGGRFVDYGDDALIRDMRPQFEQLLAAIESHPGQERLCLVFNWGRLSHDVEHRQTFTHRVLGVGGWLETLDGESARIGSVPDGRLTCGPVVV